MLRRQRLHQARRPDDPQRYGQAKERLREAEHGRRLHWRSPGERKQQPADRMAAMKTADTTKPTASQSIAIGSVRAWTRMPPSDGPATCATAFEACNRLFAATSRVRPTSEGTNAARARSVETANAPPRNDTT